MKTKIYDLTGKEKGSIDLPKEFSAKIREDIVAKILEAKKKKQPYAPSPVAGNQYSASGILKHHRHVWKSQYGRGMSRVPRKIMSRRGSQFNWVGATSPNTAGGRRAHPPKVIHILKLLGINKKELQIAFASALSATVNEKYILNKYSSIDNLNKKAPFVVSIENAELNKIKVKELLNGLKKILGKELYEIAIRKKSVRAGKGKMRGRKYKSNAGMLLVIGNGENKKIKTKMFDVVRAGELGVTDLAKGGLGRLTVYTEKAINDLNKRLNKVKVKEKTK